MGLKLPLPVPAFERAPDMWSAIRNGDVPVFHPYQSFDAVTRFVEEAAIDSKVLAIKMTPCRISPTSPVAHALARALEEVGAHVVYGMVDFKPIVKFVWWCVRRPMASDATSPGNGQLQFRTAGIYSDVGLFTCRESFGEDLTELFNLLTGYTGPQKFQHLFLMPMDLREHFISCIRREADRGRAGQTTRIIAKVNSLVDPVMIEELYLASQAGVQIDLIVRGMCSLRPGEQGLSERIRVISVITAILNTRAFSIFTTTASPSICFRLPTGCNAISTTASKLPFP